MTRALLLLAVLLTSCSAVDGPRWSDTKASGADTEALAFDTPRQQFIVEAAPDIGNVSLQGTVRGRNSTGVDAPTDGRVLDVFFARGDRVAAGDAVLVYSPAPSESELIALDIAQLNVDLAVADGAGPAQVATLETALEDLALSYAERTVTVTATASGVIGPTRQNIEYTIRKGDELFELSDPNDVVVVTTIDASERDAIRIGSNVILARSGATAETVNGQVSDVVDSGRFVREGTVAVIIDLDDGSTVELGERLTISLAVEAGDEARWVPLDAVGRQDGVPYALVSDDQGRLQRLDLDLGRRTTSHVQVLRVLATGDGLDIGTVLVAP